MISGGGWVGTTLIQGVCVSTAGHLARRMASNAGCSLDSVVHNSTPVRESTRGEKGKGRESDRGA